MPTSKQNTAEVYFFILFAALIVIPWHGTDTRAPYFDAGGMSATSLEIANILKSDILSGISAMYLHRGWRPILFPALGAPFFMFTGDHPRIGVALTQYFCLLIIVLYTWKLAGRFLSRVGAITATLFLVTLPWVVSYTTFYYAELCWLAAVCGWMFHTIASDSYREKKQSALSGFFMALMLCIRPVESAMLLGAAAPVLLVAAWRRVKNVREIRSGVGIACAIAFALTAVWWIPFVQDLYWWARACSIGDIVLTFDQRSRGAGFFRVLYRASSEFSRYHLAFLCSGAALLGVAGRVFRRGEEPGRGPVLIIALGAVTIVPMIVAFMVTGTSCYRHLFASSFILCAGLTIFLLLPQLPWRRVRVSVFCCIAALQIIVATANGFGRTSYQSASRYRSVYDVMAPELRPDANAILLSELERVLAPGSVVAVYSLCYLDFSYGCSPRGIAWGEQEALSVLSLARGSNIKFRGGRIDLSKLSELATELRKLGFTHALVDFFEGGNTEHPSMASLKVTSEVIRAVKATDSLSGLEPLRRYQWSGRDLVLFAVHPESKNPSSYRGLAHVELLNPRPKQPGGKIAGSPETVRPGAN